MTTTMAQPAENGTFEIIDVPENEQDESLNAVLGELGVDSLDDIMLKIYRTNDMGKDAHIFDTLPDAVNGIEDRLRSSYGEGDYKIKIFTPTPSGGKSVKKVIKLSIAVPLEKEEPVTEEKGEDIKDVVAAMMLAMQTQSKDMMQMFREAQLESQNKTQELLITVLSKKDDGEKPPNLLETIQTLKALEGDKKDPMDVFSQMLTMNRQIKEEMADDKPQDDSMLGTLTNGLNSLVTLATNAPAQPTVPQGAPAVKPMPIPVTNVPVQPGTKPDIQTGAPAIQQQPTGTEMNPLIKMKLKPELLNLVEKAKQGKNVAVYADLMIEEIPEQFYPQLLQALGADDDEALATLGSIEPTVLQHAEWFKGLCAEIRAAFSEAEEQLGDLEDETETGQDLTSGNSLEDDTQNNSKTDTENADKKPDTTAENESDS